MQLVSLSDMVTRALQAADMEYGGPRTEAEVIKLLNTGVQQIHGKLALNFGDAYYHFTLTAAFTAGTSAYLLPTDFYKAQGVDVQAGTGSSDYFPVRRFDEQSRGLGTVPSRVLLPRYQIKGRYIHFMPPPADTRNYRLHYSPTSPRLIKQAFTADAGADTLTLTDHGLRTNEPVRLTTDGTLPAGLATSTTYWVIYDDVDTLQLAAAEDGSAIDITDTGTGTHTLVSMYDGVDGYEEYAVLFAGVRLLDKEEGDTKQKAADRDRYLKDLDDMAANRDAGEAFPIRDVLYGSAYDPDEELAHWPTA